MRIDPRVVVSVGEFAGRFAGQIEAGRCAEPEDLSVIDQLVASDIHADTLKIGVVRVCERVIQPDPEISPGKAAVGIDEILVEPGDRGHELDHRTRLETLAHGPILIDDGQHASRLRFEDDDRPGTIAERGDRRAPCLKIFAVGHVARDIVDRHRPESAFERDPARLRLAGGLVATALGFGRRLTTFRLGAFCGCQPFRLGATVVLRRGFLDERNVARLRFLLLGPNSER